MSTDAEENCSGSLNVLTQSAAVDSTENTNPNTTVSLKDNLASARANAVRGDLSRVLYSRPYKPYALKPCPSRVLLEEDYVELLETIIERDFFPDLEMLRLQKQLLDAESRNDTRSIQTLQSSLTELKNTTGSFSCSRSKRVKLLDGRELHIDLSQLNLQDFQSLFTSEDNASFESIVQEEKLKLSREQSWIELSAIEHSMQNDAIKKSLQSGKRPAQLVYGNYESRNALMFPWTDSHSGVLAVTSDTDGTSTALCIGDPSLSLAERTNRPTGEILCYNTRLEGDNAGLELNNALQLQQIAKQSRIDKHIQDSNLFNAMISKGIYSASVIDKQKKLDQLNKSNKHYRQYQSNDLTTYGIQSPMHTPSNNNYNFIHTPSLEPGSNISPLMTWGKIAGTPLLLNPNTFVVPDAPEKEIAAHKLADTVSRKLLSAKKCRQSSGLRDIIKSASTPLALNKSSKDLFGTARMSGIRMLRHHSCTKRTGMTPLGLHRVQSLKSNEINRQSHIIKNIVSTPNDSNNQIIDSDMTSDDKTRKQSHSSGITDNLLQF